MKNKKAIPRKNRQVMREWIERTGLIDGTTPAARRRLRESGAVGPTETEAAALPPVIGPEILIMRTANGYLVDVRYRGGLYRNDPRTDTSGVVAVTYHDFFVFETFAALAAWLSERFAHRGPS